MRIRLAASALVALGAASACALGGGMIHQADTRDAQESALRASSWSVQASSDFGTTWTAPLSSYGGHFPVHVDTEQLRDQPVYQPLTLRTSAGSKAEANMSLSAGEILEGDPASAEAIRVRAVRSAEGTCAAPTFDSGSRNLLAADLNAAHPVDAPTTDQALRIPGATRTTAGSPITMCLELSLDPDAPVIPGELTLGWPIDVTRVGDRA